MGTIQNAIGGSRMFSVGIYGFESNEFKRFLFAFVL
jgi:hypothetical protein